MMPFDRLIRAMDNRASQHSEDKVVAQIGSGKYQPSQMKWTRMFSPTEFKQAVEDAAVVVAHAGMGSYLVTTEMRKPIVLLPRRMAFREHTTDHQLHTVQWLQHKPAVHIAMWEHELDGAVAQALAEGWTETAKFAHFAPESFLTKVRQFLIQ
jgi:UDP-N-acetylglucosamine transferase subunit ALG13